MVALQNWLAFTNLSLENFTLTGSLVFAKNNSLLQQENFAFCKVRKLKWSEKKNVIVYSFISDLFVCFAV